jgi:hypothetical protein
MFGVDTDHTDDHLRDSRSPNMHTGIVVVMAAIFVLLCLPTLIVNFIQYCQPAWMLSNQNYAHLYLVSELCQNLICLHHAATHAIYFVCMPQLRRDLWILVRGSSDDTYALEVVTSMDTNGMLLSEREVTPSDSIVVTTL